MNKLNKNRLVHELRFKNDDGTSFPDWELTKLECVAKRITTKNKDEKVTRVLTNSAVGGVLDQRDYFDKDIATKGNLQGYYILDKGDYVYNPRVSSTAPVGPISKNKVGKGVMSPLYTVFRFNSENNDFYEQFFKSSRWHSYLKAVSNVGARHDRMSISTSDFVAMPLPTLAEKEKQKIADFLISIDKLVTLQEQKLESLLAHKKGLQQQLFPDGDHDLPELRFLEFKGHWKKKSLGDVASFSKGKGISKSDIAIDGRLPCIRYGQLYTHYGETITRVISCTNVPSDELVLSQSNDVIIPASGETQEDIATASCVKNSGIALGGDLNIIRSSIDGVFLSYYLNGAKKSEIARMAQGNAVVHLYANQLKVLELYLPELREQQKIANCLSSIDEVITTQNRKLESLKVFKKGLVEGVFPFINGVVI
ncbi:restriction endonuclease subunit S [Vibrio sp. Isolate22]|uniref:restriction endonuclease subunit S n=1 Tax=Vibrio sp. Isolate22 TaxID=2908532 RepID=UPI001EFDACEA|nr:restriction endonuclease subunit S [Vibrio sp. Isolate22]MCG9692361.1 restriction endonuclease subunit S [Vibrio sp. Isolate22]